MNTSVSAAPARTPTPHRTRIKLCGLSTPADVEAAVSAGADAVGFVLYPPSPRAVSVDALRDLSRRLPPFVTPVVLLVNATPGEIAAALDACPTAVLQFHGDETPQQCTAPGRPFLRAVRMKPGVNLLDLAHSIPTAQALLLDAHVEGYGGGGKVFDWSLIAQDAGLPVVLSGGLHSGNVADGIRCVRPWAVDVSSGIEISRGVKSPDLMHAFCEAVRQADARINVRISAHTNAP
ncbi:phosphoribosylanthranilate isomerase [Amphibiibacter pelophylacis]|uniref:Phosphoribosylanthranilate isomerase n=1 Tax=Amphibiibacter pelophylacis TaxID=1799477 RepID=A0ACC6P3A8_9BURK